MHIHSGGESKFDDISDQRGEVQFILISLHLQALHIGMANVHISHTMKVAS